MLFARLALKTVQFYGLSPRHRYACKPLKAYLAEKMLFYLELVQIYGLLNCVNALVL